MYRLGFDFNGAFVLGNVFEEDIDKDGCIVLIPFMSFVRLKSKQASSYLTLIGAAVAMGGEDGSEFAIISSVGALTVGVSRFVSSAFH